MVTSIILINIEGNPVNLSSKLVLSIASLIFVKSSSSKMYNCDKWQQKCLGCDSLQ